MGVHLIKSQYNLDCLFFKMSQQRLSLVGWMIRGAEERMSKDIIWSHLSVLEWFDPEIKQHWICSHAELPQQCPFKQKEIELVCLDNSWCGLPSISYAMSRSSVLLQVKQNIAFFTEDLLISDCSGDSIALFLLSPGFDCHWNGPLFSGENTCAECLLRGADYNGRCITAAWHYRTFFYCVLSCISSILGIWHSLHSLGSLNFESPVQHEGPAAPTALLTVYLSTNEMENHPKHIS